VQKDNRVTGSGFHIGYLLSEDINVLFSGESISVLILFFLFKSWFTAFCRLKAFGSRQETGARSSINKNDFFMYYNLRTQITVC